MLENILNSKAKKIILFLNVCIIFIMFVIPGVSVTMNNNKTSAYFTKNYDELSGFVTQVINVKDSYNSDDYTGILNNKQESLTDCN